MCRITGFIDNNFKGNYDVKQCIVNMTESLKHGGPDDFGLYIDEENGIALGHRRLSIIDLSASGHQPMSFRNYLITYNGEIYNYKELVLELKEAGYSFHSNSDTEMILVAFHHWGLECINRFVGMFVFAILDTNTNKLTLVRDRFGVKPLYYYHTEGLFIFASELKALYHHPKFKAVINANVIPDFIRFGYIKAPYCIYQNTFKLDKGSLLELESNGVVKITKYYDVKSIYYNSEVKAYSDQEAISQCEKILTQAFNYRMVSDAPVGMFLSGGIDSTLVTAILQSGSSKPLNTFTIGFAENEYNEAEYAKQTSQHLGTNHNEIYCNENDFVNILDELPDIFDEPFADSSSIPTLLVSKLARESVTVSLSADGGDELFGGYLKYKANYDYYDKLKYIPLSIRKQLSNVGHHISPKIIFNLFSRLNDNKYQFLDWRWPKFIQSVKAENPVHFQYLISNYISDSRFKSLLAEAENNYPELLHDIPIKKNMKYSYFGMIDLDSYLEGDILTKLDRTSMSVALEGREPFLDQNILDFSFSLHDKFKIRSGETKWILRQVLKKYVPQKFIDRPKKGFAIPVSKWLRNNLSQDLQLLKLDEKFALSFGLNTATLKEIIDAFLFNKGKQENPVLIWHFYTLYKWYMANKYRFNQ